MRFLRLLIAITEEPYSFANRNSQNPSFCMYFVPQSFRSPVSGGATSESRQMQ